MRKVLDYQARGKLVAVAPRKLPMGLTQTKPSLRCYHNPSYRSINRHLFKEGEMIEWFNIVIDGFKHDPLRSWVCTDYRLQ